MTKCIVHSTFKDATKPYIKRQTAQKLNNILEKPWSNCSIHLVCLVSLERTMPPLSKKLFNILY